MFNSELQEYVIDSEHLENQKEWSLKTFGPGKRTKGVLDHIRKELIEIEQDPTDVKEWVDVIILAFDGAWRAGWGAQEVLKAVADKQYHNQFEKTWPDWTNFTEDEAIEHVR